MVVEFLTFVVDPAERAQWLTAEESNWSRFLEQQEGFVRKQMWVDEADPFRVHAVIWWETMEQWKAIPQAALDEVVRNMGAYEKVPHETVYQVIRDC
ncbi:MAG: TIGR03792 family protein [Acidimicrobiales bacterium]|nr:TIGR03792 family protein [Acidimicrobiales bacterium]